MSAPLATPSPPGARPARLLRLLCLGPGGQGSGNTQHTASPAPGIAAWAPFPWHEAGLVISLLGGDRLTCERQAGLPRCGSGAWPPGSPRLALQA